MRSFALPGLVACISSLVLGAACVTRGHRAPDASADVSWHITTARDRVIVSLRLKEQDPANEAALTDVVVPTALADAVGLKVPDGWREASGPPYLQLDGRTPIPAPAGYRHFEGSLDLSRGEEKTLTLLLSHPERGRGLLELRYQGHSDVCPLAGTIGVPIGAGPVLPQPKAPFPENPLLNLIALC